jgi:membrane-bound acyltransferase YfiQ involved in biofilm formation
MNNSTIRIALSSVLIFLSFKKLYDLVTIVLLWVNVELRIENEPILISINVALGLLSVWFLIMLSNQVLTKEKIENRIIYLLIGLTVILTVCIGVLNKLYSEYLTNTDLDNFNKTYLFQYGWTKALDMVFPILGLLYFLWKMKKIK